MTAPKNKPFTNEELARFNSYRIVNPTWGSLHIVLDDGNVKDSDVQLCIESSIASSDAEGEALARILLTKSKSQRMRLPSKLR